MISKSGDCKSAKKLTNITFLPFQLLSAVNMMLLMFYLIERDEDELFTVSFVGFSSPGYP